MEKLPIGIGILSYKRHETLIPMLETLKKNKLFDIVAEVKIFFQQIDEEDIKIAKKYKLEFLGSDTNVGISEGFLRLANSMKSEFFLPLEHDWHLIENKETTQLRLKESIELLKENYKIVRLRHRQHPGYPHFSFKYQDKEFEIYDEWHKCINPHLLDSIHWTDPDIKFPKQIKKHKNYFVTTARWANWTNNPCLYKKKFYIKFVLKHNSPGIKLEYEIAKNWIKNRFKIAHGEGLFEHKDENKYKIIQEKYIRKQTN